MRANFYRLYRKGNYVWIFEAVYALVAHAVAFGRGGEVARDAGGWVNGGAGALYCGGFDGDSAVEVFVGYGGAGGADDCG